MIDDPLLPGPGDAPEGPAIFGPDEGTPGVSALLDEWLASVDAPEPAAPQEPATLAGAVLEIDGRAALPAPEEAVSAAPDRARTERLVLFTVAATTYGVPQSFVGEVERVPKITTVPRVPAWVRGVASLRGDILSIVDLRTFLGQEPMPTHRGRMLVVKLPGEDFSAGLLVDEIVQIARVPLDEVRTPASPLEGTLASYLTGVCQVADRLVAVLDLDRFLRSPEIRQFEDPNDSKANA